MRTASLSILGLVLVLSLSGCARSGGPVVVEPPDTTPSEETTTVATSSLSTLDIGLEKVADGFEQPLCVAGLPGSGRLVVLEKTGLAKLIEGDGSVLPTPFLDLSDRVSTDSEQGLLGITFSPGFVDNGRFYVDYTDEGGTTVISRFTARADRASVDPATEEQLLRIEQPYANHNGGCIALGPDGMLWIGMGDGGSGGDPHGNGQDPYSLLGKMLRIDVGESGAPANGEPYGIPDDNPFANPTSEEDAGEPEIWALGLRNPWRFSFDRTTGDLWIGDVGQSDWEEIDFVPAARREDPSPGALNFGWNAYEGTHPFPPGAVASADPGRFTGPIIEYDRGAGQSVTGGCVDAGTQTGLAGVYFYGDFGSGRVWGARPGTDGTLETSELLDTDLQVVSFGEADDGGVYVVDFGGALYRITEK